MIQNIEIKSDAKTYMAEDGKFLLYGELYLQCGNLQFPFAGWEDILTGTVIQWIASLLELRNVDCEKKVRFYFMDGPHYFDARRVGDMLQLDLYSHDDLVNSSPILISAECFVRDVLEVSKRVMYKLGIYSKLYKKSRTRIRRDLLAMRKYLLMLQRHYACG